MELRLLLCLLTLLNVSFVASLPSKLPFTSCSSPNTIPNSPIQLAIDTVYGQIITHQDSNQRYLSLTLFGSTPQEIIGVSNDSHPLLATMFTTTSILTFNIFSNASAFCDTVRPPSPLPSLGNNTNFCPLPAGPLAFSTASPLDKNFELVSLNTRVRIVDASSPPLELLCVDVSASPLRPGILHSLYGRAVIAFWSTVSIAIAYWVLLGSARIAAAWRRASAHAPTTFWSRFQRAGFVIASAVSGERLASSPALLRFCTPSMRDVLYHTQWCALIGMVAVQWPFFAYPFFAQTAWSMLTYNITLTQGSNASAEHWDPLRVTSFDPPSVYQDQLLDPSSPLFVNQSAPNSLFNLPDGTRDGMEAFAYAVGIRPQDLFGVSVGLFLVVVAGTIVASLLIWAVDWVFTILSGLPHKKRHPKGSSSSAWLGPTNIKQSQDDSNLHEFDEEPPGSPLTPRAPSRAFARGRWSMHRFAVISFHRDVLIGNLVRLLLLFHLPITVYSSFQFTRPRVEGTVLSIVLAVLSFVIFSLALPGCLLWRLSTMRPNKLYDDTRTLLSFGPLYNQYAAGSQTFAKLIFANNLILGVVVGCGQKSGTSQAIIILVAEVASALWTSVYLPWGRGAAMGVISFLLCVSRIITSVLLVIMSPTVAVGAAASGWIAVAVLIIQAIIYALFVLLLLVKIVEAILRIALRMSFDRSRHSVDTGILGVLSMSGFFGRQGHSSRQQQYKLARSSTRGSVLVQNDPPRLTPSQMPSYIGSGSSNGPPSVLRPEHIRAPYREDLDDETGHILGAWQPYPEQGVSTKPPTPEEPRSGFTRVRGGRANFDTPFAIASAASRPFPSNDPGGVSPSTPTSANAGRPTTPSTPTSLPPGAMPPNTLTTHARTKSQTAILVDAGSLQGGRPSRVATQEHTAVKPGEATTSKEGIFNDEGDSAARRRRHWFKRRSDTPDEEAKSGGWAFFKGRRRSEGDEGTLELDEDFNPPPDSAATGSSFVVIRDRRASTPLKEGHGESASEPTTTKPPSAWQDAETIATPPVRPPRSTRRPITPQ